MACLIALSEAFAGLGELESAVRLAHQAIGLLPRSRDAVEGPFVQLEAAVRVFARARAIDAIEQLDAYLAVPADWGWSIEGLLPTHALIQFAMIHAFTRWLRNTSASEN